MKPEKEEKNEGDSTEEIKHEEQEDKLSYDEENTDEHVKQALNPPEEQTNK